MSSLEPLKYTTRISISIILAVAASNWIKRMVIHSAGLCKRRQDKNAFAFCREQNNICKRCTYECISPKSCAHSLYLRQFSMRLCSQFFRCPCLCSDRFCYIAVRMWRSVLVVIGVELHPGSETQLCFNSQPHAVFKLHSSSGRQRAAVIMPP